MNRDLVDGAADFYGSSTCRNTGEGDGAFINRLGSCSGKAIEITVIAINIRQCPVTIRTVQAIGGTNLETVSAELPIIAILRARQTVVVAREVIVTIFLLDCVVTIYRGTTTGNIKLSSLVNILCTGNVTVSINNLPVI